MKFWCSKFPIKIRSSNFTREENTLTKKMAADKIAEDWVLALSRQELEEFARLLELRTDGSRLIQADRLRNWMLGNYVSADFVSNVEVSDIVNKANRIQARDAWIKSLRDSSANNSELNQSLITDIGRIIEEDPAVQQSLARTLQDSPGQQNGESRSQFTDSGLEENRSGRNINAIQHYVDNVEVYVNNDEVVSQHDSHGDGTSQYSDDEKDRRSEFTRLQEAYKENSKLTLSFAEAMKTIVDEMREMRSQLDALNKNNQQMSSTRIDNGRRSVHIQDTYTLHSADTMINSTIDTAQESERQRNLTLAQNPRVNVTGNPANRNRFETSTGYPNTLHQNTTWNGNTRDLGAVVRKWKVRFTGSDDHMSIDHFLAKIEDCRITANLTEDELFHSLSELFQDTAAIWHRNERENWTCYQDFVNAARRWYGKSSGFEVKLQAEANARTQGEKESTKDYITQLKAVMLRMSPRPSLQKMLDLLYRNMLPCMKERIRRTEFNTVEELVDRAKAVEEMIEETKTYRPPPKPENSLLPELAYRPPAKKTEETSTTVAAAGFSNQPTSNRKQQQQQFQKKPSLLEEISKMFKESIQEMKNAQQQHRNPQQKSGSPNRRRKNSGGSQKGQSNSSSQKSENSS